MTAVYKMQNQVNRLLISREEQSEGSATTGQLIMNVAVRNQRVFKVLESHYKTSKLRVGILGPKARPQGSSSLGQLSESARN